MAQCVAQTRDGKPCQIPTREGQKYCHIHRQQRIWRFILSISAGAVVLGILSVVADITGILGYFGIQLQSGTPTPLAFVPAGEDQSLIIVADFEDRSAGRYRGIDPAQYIYEQLVDQARKDGLKDVRVERLREVVDDNSVRMTGEVYSATLVLWGWYDALTITPRIERIRILQGGFSDQEGRRFNLADPAKVEFSIVTDLPSQVAYLVFFTLAIDRYVVGQKDVALTYFTSALSAIPTQTKVSVNPSQTYFYRGNLYAIWRSDYKNAIADYNHAIQLNPDYAEAYNNRGSAYDSMGDYDRAIADYDRAIQLKPDSALIYNNRGGVYDIKGDHDRAIADFDKAIQLDPNYVGAYTNRGISYKDKGDHDRAIADFDKAIELNPDYAEAYNSRGNAYVNKRDYDRAIADYDRAIQLKPDEAVIYNNRGGVYGIIPFNQSCFTIAA